MEQRGKPVKQETDYKENMVAAYIHLAITRTRYYSGWSAATCCAY